MCTTMFAKLTQHSKALETIQMSSHRLPVVRKRRVRTKKGHKEIPGGNEIFYTVFYGWWMDSY